jgi:hypothetical protein
MAVNDWIILYSLAMSDWILPMIWSVSGYFENSKPNNWSIIQSLCVADRSMISVPRSIPVHVVIAEGHNKRSWCCVRTYIGLILESQILCTVIWCERICLQSQQRKGLWVKKQRRDSGYWGFRLKHTAKCSELVSWFDLNWNYTKSKRSFLIGK